MKIPECKAVLIDFDGTLFDSLPALYQTYCEYLEMAGFEGNSDEFRLLNGLSLEEIAIFLHEKYRIKGTLEEQIDLYKSLLKKNYHVELKIFPGVKEFFAFAHQTHLKLAVVSSGNSDFIHQILKAEKISHYFSAVVTPQGNEKCKPAPDLYLKALSVLSLKPDQAIAIEDAPLGVKASLAAGIFTLQITHGERIKAPKGVKVVENWEEILRILSHEG